MNARQIRTGWFDGLIHIETNLYMACVVEKDSHEFLEVEIDKYHCHGGGAFLVLCNRMLRCYFCAVLALLICLSNEKCSLVVPFKIIS